VQPGRNGAREARPEAIRDSAQAASPPHGPPAIHAQHHVHAAAPEPGPLVEAVRLGTRQRQHAERLELGALRWRTAERKFEQDGLVRPEPPEAGHEARSAEREPATPRRACDDDERPFRATDLCAEHATVESVEPRASPPPSCNGESEREDDEAAIRCRKACRRDQTDRRHRKRRDRSPNRVRGRDPAAERT
jgi:hypothetical protein